MSTFISYSKLTTAELEDKRSLLIKKMNLARGAMASEAVLDAIDTQYQMIQAELEERMLKDMLKDQVSILEKPIYSSPDKLENPDENKVRKRRPIPTTQNGSGGGITINKSFQKNYRKN